MAIALAQFGQRKMMEMRRSMEKRKNSAPSDKISNLTIRRLSAYLRTLELLESEGVEVDLAILGVPPPEIQTLVNRLWKLGIRGILYFASRSVNHPEDMIVLNQDISTEIGIITYRLNHERHNFRE